MGKRKKIQLYVQIRANKNLPHWLYCVMLYKCCRRSTSQKFSKQTN